jgi:hypothetical protein
MPAKSDPRDETAGAEYFYRRSLHVGELLPAIGAGLAAGILTFYVARLVLQRTPLIDLSGDTTQASGRRSRSARSHGG